MHAGLSDRIKAEALKISENPVKAFDSLSPAREREQSFGTKLTKLTVVNTCLYAFSSPDTVLIYLLLIY